MHGYRRGRNTRTAALALQAALRAGNSSVFFTDVQDFYPSVDLGLLRAELAPILPPSLVAIVMALLDGVEGRAPGSPQTQAEWVDGAGLPNAFKRSLRRSDRVIHARVPRLRCTKCRTAPGWL